MRVAVVAVVALVLSSWRNEVWAQAGACAPPPVWSASAARRGRPFQEMTACLRSEAFKARGLHVPIDSVANGLAAICEVEVDRIEGSHFFFNDLTQSHEERRAREEFVMRQATVDATQYKDCAR